MAAAGGLVLPDAWSFLLMSLALWRLSSLISQEPVFAWFRGFIGVTHDSDGNPVGYTNPIAQGLQCLWCVSVWLSPLILGLFLVVPIIVVALAMSTMTILLDTAISFTRFGRG